MITTLDKSKYIIDKSMLNEILKKSTPISDDEKREALLLDTFIKKDDFIPDILSLTNDFYTISKQDYKVFIDEYYDYLVYIFEFYDLCMDDEKFTVYEKVVSDYEQVFASVHDFFKDLNGEWFNIFNKLYNNRFKCISLSRDRSYSLLFPNYDIWLANIEVNGTINDYVNMVHEFAHGICDTMSVKVKTYSNDNIFIELFPIVCELLFLGENKDLRYQIELNKCLNNIHIIMLQYAEEIKTRYNILSSFTNVTSAKNLARLIRKKWKQPVSKSDILKIYSSSIVDNFHYVFPYIIAKELIDIYLKEKDLFIYKMNKLIISNDSPLESLKKLQIIPNGTIK